MTAEPLRGTVAHHPLAGHLIARSGARQIAAHRLAGSGRRRQSGRVLAENWGATAAERGRAYACDTFLPHATLRAWRAVSIEAPPPLVWAWVGQIRLAPYSYDLIDNAGRRSPGRLLDLPEPIVGEPFTRCGGRPQGRIVDVRPTTSLTGTILGAFLTYAVTASPGGRTRLVLKVVADSPPVLRDLVSLGDLVMARRQLLNLKSHIERTADGVRPGGPPRDTTP